LVVAGIGNAATPVRGRRSSPQLYMRGSMGAAIPIAFGWPRRPTIGRLRRG